MRRTILLADDSPTIRRLVTQTLADGDFKIVEVNNGDAAIKTFEEVRPSVVLADVYMPGKNGYQVCTYIRHHKELGGTPVVLLVGAFDAFDEEAAKQAGATAHITKPFEPTVLIELVRTVLTSEEGQAAAETPPDTPVDEIHVVANEGEDLFGLGSIFQEEPPTAPPSAITEQDIDRIADRVIQRLSTQVIENIAWEILPDITEKIVREELKRNQ